MFARHKLLILPPVTSYLPNGEPSPTRCLHGRLRRLMVSHSSQDPPPPPKIQMLTLPSVALCASRSLTCRTRISSHAHAGIRYIFHSPLSRTFVAAIDGKMRSHVTDVPSGVSILLQQHQEQHERPVSRLPKTVLGEKHRVENHQSGRVGCTLIYHSDQCA